MHCQDWRRQVDAEAALALQVVALHGAVGASDDKALVTARYP